MWTLEVEKVIFGVALVVNCWSQNFLCTSPHILAASLMEIMCNDHWAGHVSVSQKRPWSCSMIDWQLAESSVEASSNVEVEEATDEVAESQKGLKQWQWMKT